MTTPSIKSALRRLTNEFQNNEFREDEPFEEQEVGRCEKCCHASLKGCIKKSLWCKKVIETCYITRFLLCAAMYAFWADVISDILAVSVFWKNGDWEFASTAILCLYLSSRFGVNRYARNAEWYGFWCIPSIKLSIRGILLAFIPFVGPWFETDLSRRFNSGNRVQRKISNRIFSHRPVSCRENIWLIFYCILIEFLCVLGSVLYSLIVFWEISRLTKIYWVNLREGYDRPPEFIIIALVEAFEALPQLIIQIIAFYQQSFSMNPSIFYISIAFSCIGLLKAIVTFAWYYDRLVAGIEDVYTMRNTGNMTINRGTFYEKDDGQPGNNMVPWIQGDVREVKTLNLDKSKNLEIDSIPTLPNLTKLQITNCELLNFGVKKWSDRFPKLTELNCRSNSLLTANPFPSLPELKVLCLRDIGVSLLELLLKDQVPKLEELDLSANPQLEIEVLPPLPFLRKLTIQNHPPTSTNGSTESPASFIVPSAWSHCFYWLRTLVLDFNAVDVDSIPEFPVLSVLSMKQCNLKDLGRNAKTLKERLPSLQVLDLTKNPINILHLTQLPLLQELALDYTDQTSVKLYPNSWYGMFPSLSSLGLSGNPCLFELSHLNESISRGKLRTLRLLSTGDENGRTLAPEAQDLVEFQ